MQNSIQLSTPTYTNNYPQLSPAAIAVGLFFTLLWPPVVGLALGLAGFLWYNNSLYIKGGVVLGILGGCVLSLTFLFGSVIYRRLTAQPELTETMQEQTINYLPLGSVPGENMHIVPLRTYDKLLDKVPQRDVAWFCLGISRGLKHSQRAWLGKKAPSGTLVDPVYWQSLSNPLRKAGIIKDVSRRRSGILTTRDLDKMLSIMGLDPMDTELWLGMTDPTE